MRRAVGPRGGLTLIELVMVVSLLVVLAAIAIPSVQLAVEGRRVREAARAVNVYLGAARNRAMATGRLVGVAFERFDNESNMSITLHQVESPPDYAGETVNANAQVYFQGPTLKAQLSGFQATRVLPGDRIQFNHQGHWYPIASVDGSSLTLNPDASWSLPWPPMQVDGKIPDDIPDDSIPMPYTIRRQPGLANPFGLHGSIAKPMQLPLDAVVDMTFSGGSGGTIARNAFANDTSSVVILFSPNGGLDRVYYAGGADPVTEPLYLLIGKRERIPGSLAEDGRSNLQDPENVWISISPRTGLIGTAENAMVADDSLIDDARLFARGADSMGGR